MSSADTLNLPKTDFPMKANLPEREPETMKLWDELGIYGLVRRRGEGRPRYLLHDGPPYANGDIHLGTAQNKVLKDITVKFMSMRGYDCPYVPGWDTHGLPIEQALYRETGRNWREVGAVDWRRQCKDLALRYMGRQREQFQRLGVRGLWERPYLTLSPAYEAKQIEVFGEIARGGNIYRGLRPVYWCGHCETALADAEIEYMDRTSDSVYVRFPWASELSRLSKLLSEGDRVSVVIWTTTPWTLPANMAIALHPEARYVLAYVGDEHILVADNLLDRLLAMLGAGPRDVIAELRGSDLKGALCQHPFADRQVPLVMADYVTLEDGTGCVHTAPGHGEEDFLTGREYGLEILSPLNDKAELTEGAGIFAGKYVEDANPDIIAWLRDNGYLMHSNKVQHQYPHCWRCHGPIAFRATEQWFVNVAGLRDPAMAEVSRVRWVPGESEQRIKGMMESRPDWCISRQRPWGVPLPIFYCGDCGESIFTEEATGSVADVFADRGSDAWWELETAELLPEGFTCPKCGGPSSGMTKETDIMDVWFDSGTSYAGVLETDDDLGFPADLYLEGSDQHRGWFQSSLLTSMASRGRPPYKTVVTHGFVVDEQGRKMSKSLGNTLEPTDIINRYGADVLRLWVCYVDCKRDLHCSEEILKQVATTYVRIRNTCRFLMGNLFDFDPETDRVPHGEMGVLERWALARFAQVLDRATRAYGDWDYHLIYQDVHSFCAVDLSALVLDVHKDRLYVDAPGSQRRRSAQTALYDILDGLTRLLAPIMTFTCEEIWQHFFRSEDLPSVQLAPFPEGRPEWEDEELLLEFSVVLEARQEIYRAIERARDQGLFKKPLDGRVALQCPEALSGAFDRLENAGLPLADLLIVSEAEHGREPLDEVTYRGEHLPDLAVQVARAEGEKCPRCWHVVPELPGTGAAEGLCARCAEVVI